MGNPVFNSKVFENVQTAAQGGVMTIAETINRVYVLLGILFIAGGFTWYLGVDAAPGMMFLSLIIAFILAIVTTFKPMWAPITAPIYAIFEGFVLGAVSRLYENAYGGIVMQALLLTLMTLATMLYLYASRIIKATENLKIGIIAATGGIALVYIFTMVLGLFGVQIPYIHDSGIVGIGFSLFVVGIAAFNFIIDFDFIEQGSTRGLPRYMEWYGAFGLILTVVWLYLEILRLLSKLNSRR